MPNCLKEKESEEVEDDQFGVESDPREMVVETVAKIISYNVSETQIDAELITHEIKEWQEAMHAKIATLIGDEMRELVLCPNGVKIVGCMWVDSQESWSGGTVDLYIAWLKVKGFNHPYEFDLYVTYGPVSKINIIHV